MNEINLIPMERRQSSSAHNMLTLAMRYFSHSRYSGEGWSLPLAKNWHDFKLAQGEKSLAVWHEASTGPRCRIHLFRYGKVLLHTDGVLEEPIAGYFCEEPQILHSERKNFAKDSKQSGPDGLLMFRALDTNPGEAACHHSSSIFNPHTIQLHINDATEKRDFLVFYYIDDCRKQLYALTLTYPSEIPPEYISLVISHQKDFHQAAMGFKIQDADKTKWNGLFFTPSRGA